MVSLPHGQGSVKDVTFSVGSNTGEASLTEEVKRYRGKRFKEKQESLLRLSDKQSPANESLQLKCIKVLVEHFEERPTHEMVDAKHLREITSRLPINLDPKQSAMYVHDENYWKRACLDERSSLTPSECQIVEHGMTWKQLYFEHHLRQRLEFFHDGSSNNIGSGSRSKTNGRNDKSDDENDSETVEDLLDEIQKYQDYIFNLSFKQLPSHLEVDRVCQRLPNLTKMDVQYGINKIGMDFDRRLFGMKISDASCLAKSIKDSQVLTLPIPVSPFCLNSHYLFLTYLIPAIVSIYAEFNLGCPLWKLDG